MRNGQEDRVRQIQTIVRTQIKLGSKRYVAASLPRFIRDRAEELVDMNPNAITAELAEVIINEIHRAYK
jgi:hypothetical protein